MPAVRLGQFQRDIARARDLVGLGQSLGAMTQGLVDSSDIFRAALVQAVAAMDNYVHGVVLDRGVDILVGRASPGSATKVGLPFHAVSDILAAPSVAEGELAARTHLAQRLTLETYQTPDNIGTALAMVGVAKIWSTTFADAAERKTAVSLVVQRRNRIVHQCDADPLSPGAVTSLTDEDALAAVDVLERTITAVDTHC